MGFRERATSLYGGYTRRSEIEAPLITRKVLLETYFLLVIMATDGNTQSCSTRENMSDASSRARATSRGFIEHVIRARTAVKFAQLCFF
jgi:hypothetical protein